MVPSNIYAISMIIFPIESFFFLTFSIKVFHVKIKTRGQLHKRFRIVLKVSQLFLFFL